jgi:hypothetical protein
VKAYVQALRDRQLIIGEKLGTHLQGTPKEDRVLNLSVLALLSVLIKTLVDKGVITDAELTATLNEARDDAWPDEPNLP